MIWPMVAVFGLLAGIIRALPDRHFKNDPHSQPVMVFVFSLLAVVFLIIGLASLFIH